MKTFRTPKGTELPLMSLQGKDYLQVTHRVVWFREEHPLGKITTECVHREKDFVIYRATIELRNPDGLYSILADAVKREDYAHFKDADEKASTGAVGRALALCGYGTAFTHELEEGERLADAPVQSNTATKIIESVAPQSKTPFKVPEKFAHPERPSSYAADYVIDFGKHKGTALKDFGDTDLRKYINDIKKMADEKNQKVQGPALTLTQKAELYFNAKKKPNIDPIDEILDTKFNSHESFETPPWPTESELPF
jgi:hypothetical protein